MAHFIIEKAKKYEEPSDDNLLPMNGLYDIDSGYWRDNNSGDALVGTDALNGVNSKKWDRETGEDQKGE